MDGLNWAVGIGVIDRQQLNLTSNRELAPPLNPSPGGNRIRVGAQVSEPSAINGESRVVGFRGYCTDTNNTCQLDFHLNGAVKHQ